MSFSINYFFNSDKSLSELVAEINEVIGCSLILSAGSPEYSTAFPFFGMEFSLCLNPTSDYEGYVDAGELKFSQYNYDLDLTTYWGQADARPTQLPIMLSIVYMLHRRLGIMGMLVYDIQILLAKYEERQIEENLCVLYDIVTETKFLRFADHMEAIQKRLPDGYRNAYVSKCC